MSSVPDAVRVLSGVAGLFLSTAGTRSQLEAFQLQRVRALVRHAYDRVPYYRRLFEQAGFEPDHVRTLKDLQRIPQTSRSALLEVSDNDLVTRGIDPSRLVLHRTSGSTGVPLSIRRTRFEERLLHAYRRWVTLRLGVRLTDRRAGVWTVRPKKTPLYTRFGLLRSETIDCLEPADRILSRLRALRPDVLGGYPGTLAWLADAADEADRGAIQPHLIITGAETLTSDMRARIVAAFGARVIDFYSSHEFNMIAWECPSSGLYHVSDASVIAEVMVDGRPAVPGEVGELVGTALHSWAMPFVRLRLGDLVTRGPDRCPCGASNSILANINGRVADRFELSDGTSFHPYTLVRPLVAHGTWIRQYQIVQERSDRICVKVVPLAGRSAAPDELRRLGEVLRARLAADVGVEVQQVDAIPRAASGKLRPFVPLSSGAASAPPLASTIDLDVLDRV